MLYIVIYEFGYFSSVAVKWWNNWPYWVVYFGKEIEVDRCDVCMLCIFSCQSVYYKASCLVSLLSYLVFGSMGKLLQVFLLASWLLVSLRYSLMPQISVASPLSACKMTRSSLCISMSSHHLWFPCQWYYVETYILLFSLHHLLLPFKMFV